MVTNNTTKEFVTPSSALLASLGTHRRHRPLSPVEVAKELENFFEKGGRPEQLPVGTEVIRAFLSLLTLPNSVQRMLGWAGVDKGEIGMDSGYRISMLKMVNDQEILAKTILERGLTSKEVRRIVRHRNRHREKSIEDCIETVVAMRPVKRHLFITQLSGEALKRLEREAEMQKISSANLLQEILSKELPSGSLISLTLRENFVTLLLEKEGNEALLKRVKESGVPLKEAVDVIVSKRL